MDLVPVPEGIPQSVLYRVRAMLVSGFQPAAVVDQIDRAEGVKLSIADVADYARSVALPETPSLRQEFGGEEAISDPLAEAHRALLILGSRIAKRMNVEAKSPEKQPDQKIDALLLNYLKAAQELADLMDRLGVNPYSKGSKSNDKAPLSLNLTLRDMIERPNVLLEKETIDGEYTDL